MVELENEVLDGNVMLQIVEERADEFIQTQNFWHILLDVGIHRVLVIANLLKLVITDIRLVLGMLGTNLQHLHNRPEV